MTDELTKAAQMVKTDEDLGDLAPEIDDDDAVEVQPPADPSTDNEPEGTPPGDGDDEAGEDEPVEVQP